MTEHETKPLEPFGLPEEPSNASSGNASMNQVPSEDRLWAGLAYWSQIVLPGVLPAILLLSGHTNKNKFVRYHAIHSLAFILLSVIYLIIATIFVITIAEVASFTLCMTWLLFLVPAVPLIYYGVHAYKGETRNVPWLTGFLKQCRLI
ncbi:MAG: DUF4870 domain-containing protein [Chloroflexi bacterium]|nr:DUF4870 domain-containing protein [Chloroflexota bacterium]